MSNADDLRKRETSNKLQPRTTPNASRQMRCLWNEKEQVYQEPEGKGFLNGTINILPFEMHISGHNFTGPGTKLKNV